MTSPSPWLPVSSAPSHSQTTENGNAPSVACHASIVCRHGYVVDDECSLKSRLSARGVDEDQALAG